MHNLSQVSPVLRLLTPPLGASVALSGAVNWQQCSQSRDASMLQTSYGQEAKAPKYT